MDLGHGCPGRDRSNWTPDDIFEAPCCHCGALVEFFKDDARRTCPSCGQRTPNPRQDVGCAGWCGAAEKCSVGRNALNNE